MPRHTLKNTTCSDDLCSHSAGAASGNRRRHTMQSGRMPPRHFPSSLARPTGWPTAELLCPAWQRRLQSWRWGGSGRTKSWCSCWATMPLGRPIARSDASSCRCCAVRLRAWLVIVQQHCRSRFTHLDAGTFTVPRLASDGCVHAFEVKCMNGLQGRACTAAGTKEAAATEEPGKDRQGDR